MAAREQDSHVGELAQFPFPKDSNPLMLTCLFLPPLLKRTVLINLTTV